MRLLCALLLIAICAGCRTSRLQTQQFLPPPPPQQPTVWIRGDVQNRAIAWNEELTLATAIVAAEYKGLWDPHSISVIRHGRTYKVNPRDLLKGREDPPLEPGDIVVIER